MKPHTQASNEARYNLEMLEELEDNEYLLEILTIWLMESPKDISDMTTALRERKIDAVCKKAHKLKSSAGVIQAKQLKDLLEELEKSGKNGAAVETLESILKQVDTEYSLIEVSLKSYIEILQRKIA